jgi:aminopeptidase N
MELWQEAPERHATLRPHSTTVGLVTDVAGAAGLSVTSIPVHIDGARKVVSEAIGMAPPCFVFPNHGDHDYALAILDPLSLAFALERLPDLPGPLLRQQVWSTLWQMVRDARLSSLDFLGVVHRFAPAEEDLGLVQAILDRAVASLKRYVPVTLLDDASSRLVDTALGTVQQTDHEDLGIVWTRAAIAVASASDDLERLLGLVDGTWSVHGFALDQEMRWALAVKAMAHGHEDADERLAVESVRDRSDRGARAILRAQASRPDEHSKGEAWERINGAGYGSDYLTRAAMAGFQWGHQRALLEPFREHFFERIRDVYRGRDHVFAQSYVRWLVPDLWAEPTVLGRLRAESAALDEENELLRRQLDEVGDDLERAIRVQAYAAASV